MKIIILRLPTPTTKKELKQLVSTLLSKRLHVPFTPKPLLSACEILHIRDRQGVVEHHGLIQITPEKAGQWFIRHFKKQRLRGKMLFAREYIERRRNDTSLPLQEERRRPNLDINTRDALHVDTEGLTQFIRKYS